MTDRYVHGYAAEEQERLVAQAEHWRDDLILPGTTLRSGTRLLEVGCGVGAVLGILGSAFPSVELTGVDYEERQIEAARAHLSSLGLQADLRRADAVDLPFGDGSFEHVWMMWLLEHVADPVAALREARRVLVPGGELTAIEVDYSSVWASPSSDALDALFASVARAMDANGRSDAGARLEKWLVDAGFGSVDPGERRLAYSTDDLVRQVPYVAAVVESTLATRLDAGDTSAADLKAALDELKTLPDTPHAALGWVVHKAHARATSSR
jgi:ubiquinone/menaquinone biosynthesis C-methylase UbiE